jgi:hypothetical protein
LDNKQPCEVHRGLGNLGEWPTGDERERGGELTVTAAMAGGELGVAHCREEQAAFIGGLGSVVTTA